MKRMIWLGIACMLLMHSSIALAQQEPIQSPDQFLPYKLGSRFSPHHLLVDYFKYIDSKSDRVQLVQYGQTYEYRPLMAAIISTPENMRRLESIRLNNMRRVGNIPGEVVDDSIAIVYLSFSVHGNEAAGSESSMAVLYDLVKGGNPADQWLKHTIVIIDPSLNPDGYTRFTQYSNSFSTVPNDPRHEVREHDEPWPGGRYNHYIHDLNRDWVWQTQQETRARIAFYQQWMPQVHADLHEMESEASYYFAPAAQPYHPYLTAWQGEFQKTIGQNHARHFDEKGWRYYSKERFDLFYPGYGDTYPSFAGAIGMTYEQGGSGYGNRAILLDNGDTLTLYDRIAHHREAALSTIEVTANHASRLNAEFISFFQKSRSNPPGAVKSYIIRQSNASGKIADLQQLLNHNGIEYGIVRDEKKSVKGFSYGSGGFELFTVQKGDMIVPAAQTRSVLLQVLFEPEGKLSDSLTYDITAWSIPMAYGLDAYATEETIAFNPTVELTTPSLTTNNHPVAYALQWGSVTAVKTLMAFLKEGLVARYAMESFRSGSTKFEAGTIVLMRSDNKRKEDFDEIMKSAVSKYTVSITPITSGYMESGKDLGSDSYPLVRKPEVLALSGDDISPAGLGEVWHFFEEELNYPLHIVNVSQLDHIDLDPYSILIFNEGYFDLSESSQEKINNWIRNGGQLITIGSSVSRVAGKGGFSIEQVVDPTADTLEEKVKLTAPVTYASNFRNSISSDISGAVFKTQMDKTDPLSFGLGPTYWTLKTSAVGYQWLKHGRNAVYINDTPDYYGFVGAKALEKTKRTLIAGSESMGRGSVVYLVDNPLFRSFWNNGKILFSNALFF